MPAEVRVPSWYPILNGYTPLDTLADAISPRNILSKKNDSYLISTTRSEDSNTEIDEGHLVWEFKHF